MNKQEIIQKTSEYAKSTLAGEGSGHDWWHVYRVWKNGVHIGKDEEVDMFIVELACLLHDISDWKFNDGDETVGPKLAREWLQKLDVDENAISHVCDIIKNMSFKGAKTKVTAMQTKEGMVVQDADRLDAIGAIGIGRAFAYGGHINREMYSPDIPPQYHTTSEEYKNAKGPTVNHFYEKLLLLKDLMNTKTAQKIAEKRHTFMERFLDEFLSEWDGRS